MESFIGSTNSFSTSLSTTWHGVGSRLSSSDISQSKMYPLSCEYPSTTSIYHEPFNGQPLSELKLPSGW